MAATNVQAFSGDVEVASNLAVDTNVLFVDSVNNKVGIGVTEPGATIEVTGNAYVSSNLEVGTANLFVDTVNSRVGIGTTSPEVPFNVVGNNALSGTPNNVVASFRAANSNPGTNDAGVVIGSVNGNTPYIADVSSASLGLYFYTQNAERMRISSSGNIGINTTAAPVCQLHITGQLLSSNTDDTNGLLIMPSGLGGGGNTNEYVVGHPHLGVAQFQSEQPGSDNLPSVSIINKDRDNNVLKNASIGFFTTDTAGTSKFVGKIGFWPGDGNSVTGQFRIYTVGGSAGYDQPAQRMVVTASGAVGINETNPNSILHVNPNTTTTQSPSTTGVYIYNSTSTGDATCTIRVASSAAADPYVSYDISGEHGWSIGIDNSAGTQLRFSARWDGFLDTRGYLNTTSVANEIDFTGQHRSFVSNVPHTEYLNLEGLIVSANKNQYFDIQEEVVTGVQAIKINESLPLVSISNVAYDKSCFGVISGSEDTNDREYSQGSFVSVLKKQDGDIRAHINSVGEGAIWVTNLNGTLESGDYITTSNIAGYGQKQDSEFLANYTVAKITMDCDFEPATQPVQIIKRELRDVNYWVKYTYDDISEEEYTRVKNLGRRVRIIESGTEISQEEYENHIKKEGYTITESNTYIRNDTTYQRVFSDKEKEPKEGYQLEVRNEPVNVLDEHGQIQWEDDPSGATEKAYKIRYFDADGNITDEANHVYKAAFVGCTYHCG